LAADRQVAGMEAENRRVNVESEKCS
jgi:hypothetical protein